MRTKKAAPPPQPSLEVRLLMPPSHFSRTKPHLAHFRMYSIKLGRSINCESAAAFALALWLEVDAEVRKYNERPPELDVNSVEQKSRNVRPAATSMGAGRSKPTLHVIQGEEAEQIDWEA